MIRWFQSFIWISAWFRHFCHSQSQKTPFHSVTLEGREYRRPSSFSCRIKRPCSHWNSWFYPLKFWHTPRNIYPAIKCTHEQRFDMYFHSQPGILPITSPFRRLFHYHERQNVGSKSDILKMFHNLKPPTIFISTHGRSIPLFILQLIEKLSIINVVRAKTQKRILWWVCLKVSKMILFQSIWRKRQFINLWFLT